MRRPMGGPDAHPLPARVRLLPAASTRRETPVNAPITTTDTPRRNFFPGRCHKCGGNVRKLCGYRKQDDTTGAWLIYCEPHYPAITTAPRVADDVPASASAPSDANAPRMLAIADLPRPTVAAVRITAELARRAREIEDHDGRAAMLEIAAILVRLHELHGEPAQTSAPADAPAPADIAADVLADLGLGAPRAVPSTPAPVTAAPAFRLTADAMPEAAARPTRNADAADGVGMRRRFADGVPAPTPTPTTAPAPTPTPAPTRAKRAKRAVASADRFAALRGSLAND